MAHILKIVRGLVKTIAVLISLAFVVNSLTGVTTIVNIVDNQGIEVQDFKPGDFRIKYDDLYIQIGITLNNSGIYPMENVKLGMRCELQSNLSTEWHEIINTDSTQLNSSIPAEGDLIEPGSGPRNITITADLPDFSSNPSDIATILGITNSTWNFSDLLNADFKIRVFLNFTIAYAYGQYDILANIALSSEDLEGAF